MRGRLGEMALLFFFCPLGVFGDRGLAASTIGIRGLYALFYEERLESGEMSGELRIWVGEVGKEVYECRYEVASCGIQGKLKMKDESVYADARAFP